MCMVRIFFVHTYTNKGKVFFANHYRGDKCHVFWAAANTSVAPCFHLQWLLVAAETKKKNTYKFHCTWWKQQYKTFSETNTCSGHHKPNYLNVTVYSMLRMETTKASLCRRKHRCTAFHASFSGAIENGSNQCKSEIIWVCLAYLFTGTMHG